MTKNCTPTFLAHLAAGLRFHLGFTRLLALILLTGLTTSLTALAADETLDVQYLRIYSQIDQADSFSANGNEVSAKQTYKDAQAALQAFKKNNPTWNASLVAYRLNYLVQKIDPQPAVILAEVKNTAVTPKPAQKTSPKPVSKNATASPAPTVKLISAGAEPRKELRIRSKVGDKQNLEFTTKMAMDMGTGQTMKMPATKMTLEVTVQNVSAEGDISYDAIIGDVTVLDEPGVLPQVAESMKASLNGMKGLSMKGVMSDHGVTKSFDIKIPAGVAPQMRQAMEQMKESLANISTPFPDEAIGIGAEWEFKLPIKSQGMKIDQVTIYQLISTKENGANVASKITQNAANQKITNPAMPQMKIDLIQLTSEGSGNVTFDLTKPLPVSGTMKSSTASAMGMNIGGKVQEMNMKMDMNMRLESK